MDPNATLYRIAEETKGTMECTEACADLADWLESGGFEPDWTNPVHTDAASVFFRFCEGHGRWGH